MSTSPLVKEVINAYFSDLLSLEPLKRFVYLHIYVGYNRVSLANICLLLRPLEQIWAVAVESPHSLTSHASSSPADDFIRVMKETNVPFGDPLMLSKFVISAMFSTLVGSVFPRGKDATPSNLIHTFDTCTCTLIIYTLIIYCKHNS